MQRWTLWLEDRPSTQGVTHPNSLRSERAERAQRLHTIAITNRTVWSELELGLKLELELERVRVLALRPEQVQRLRSALLAEWLVSELVQKRVAHPQQLVL